MRVPHWAATWLEHWPPALQLLSLRHQGLALTPLELCALGRQNGVAAAAFGPEPTAGADALVLSCLTGRLDTLLRQLGGNRAFIRLGSRSPKDTPLAVLGGLEVRSGAEALAVLCAGSARLAFDLRVALQADLPVWVFLREWVDISWPDEWRGFLRRGRLVAACPYHYRHPLPPSASIEAIQRNLIRMGAAVAAARRGSPEADLVFDVWLPAGDGHAAKLIEINPWGEPTDAGLFSWADADLDGTLRWRSDAGLCCVPLVS
ncbi:MAG: hypothetical protein KF778_08670 [Rhodocyclaceae bacterium]|nr:hypothetical protein [Rhodocyclaceae bacterium]